jgi:hypothetical protein
LEIPAVVTGLLTLEITARSLVRDAVELTTKLLAGVDDPIPTFPFWRIVKSEAPVEDAIATGLVPAVPRRENVAIGVAVPTPILPFEAILNH